MADIVEVGRERPSRREPRPLTHLRLWSSEPRITSPRSPVSFAIGLTVLFLGVPHLAASQPLGNAPSAQPASSCRTRAAPDPTDRRQTATGNRRPCAKDESSRTRGTVQPAHAAPHVPAGSPLGRTRGTSSPGSVGSKATPVADRPARVPGTAGASRSKRPGPFKRRGNSRLRSPAVPKEPPFLFEVRTDGGQREPSGVAAWS